MTKKDIDQKQLRENLAKVPQGCVFHDRWDNHFCRASQRWPRVKEIPHDVEVPRYQGRWSELRVERWKKLHEKEEKKQ